MSYYLKLYEERSQLRPASYFYPPRQFKSLEEAKDAAIYCHEVLGYPQVEVRDKIGKLVYLVE